MSTIATKLLAIVSDMTKQDDRDTIVSSFTRALDELFEDTSFQYSETREAGMWSFEMCTANKSFGWISCKMMNEIDPETRSAIEKAVRLLAVILENRSLRMAKTDRDKQLQEDVDRYRVSFNASPITIMVLQDDRIIFCNPAAAAMMGYDSPDEMTGMLGTDLVAENYRPAVMQRLRNLSHDAANPCMEMEILKKDGSTLISESTSVPIHLSGQQAFVVFGQDITERKRAQQALVKQQQRMEKITDTIPVGITILNKDGQILYANIQAEHILRLKKTEITQRAYNAPEFKITDYDGIPISNGQLPFVLVKKYKKSVYSFKHAIEWANGERKLLRINASPLLDDSGEFDGLVASIEDVTEWESATQALNDSLQTSADIVRLIPSGMFIYQFRAPDKLYLENGNPQAEKLTTINTKDWIGKEFNEIWPSARERGVTDAYLSVIKTGQQFETDDLFYSDDRLSGAFRIRAFKIPGERLAVAFENITEQKKAETALKEREHYYRSLLFNMHEDIIVINREYKIHDLNNSAANSIGLSRDEILGHPCYKLLRGYETPCKLQKNGCLMKEVFESGESRSCIHTHTTHQGKHLYADILLSPLKSNDGNVTHVVEAIRDITEIMETQIKLKETEERFRNLFDSMSSGVAVYEAVNDGEDFIFKDFNKASEKIEHVSREEVIGKSVKQIFPGVIDFGLFEIFKRVYQSGVAEDHPISLYQDNRIVGWRENYVYKAPTGEIVAIYDDVTEQKRANEERDRMFNLSIDMLCIAGFDGYFKQMNPAWSKTFGWSDEEMLAKPWIEFVHPDDREATIKARHHLIDGKLITSFENRYLCKNGTYRWISWNSFPLPNEKLIFAVARDVTEQKQAEEKIQRNFQDMETLNRVSQKITSSLSLNEVTKTVVEAIAETMQPDLTLLFLIDKNDLILQDFWASESRFQHNTTPVHKVGEYLCGIAVRDAMPVYSLNVSKDKRCSWQECKDAGIISFAALPLHGMHKLIGVLGIASAREKIDFQKRASFLEILSNEIAIALQNALLYDDVRQNSMKLAKTVTALKKEIRERKRVEIVIKESEARLRSIFLAAPTGIGMVVNRVLTQVNDRFCDMLLYARDELLNNSARILYPNEEIYSWVGQEKYRQIAEKGTGTVETRMRRKDGKIIDVILSSTPIDPADHSKGVTFTALDISERKRMENELRVSKEQYRDLVDNATEAIFIIQDYFIKFANPKMEEITGYSTDEIFKINQRDLIHPADIDGVNERFRNRIEGIYPLTAHSFRIYTKQKQLKWVEVNAVRIEWQGKPGVLCFMNDITERRNADEQIRKLNTELELRVKKRTFELEAVNKELKNFAYVVSHDLKAPLRAISQLSDWILNDYMHKLDATGQEYLNTMIGRVQRMDLLIEGILEYSRIGRLEKNAEPQNLNAIVSDVIENIGPIPHIRITVDDNLPTLNLDKIRAIQLFQNLIHNAIKFIDKPEGVIRISCCEMENFWEFSVSDNGPGIDAKYYDRIFHIFQTLETKDKSESTGIGLAVVKKIVEYYGGSVWVESTLGQGTTFNFTLPK
ncbi:PAS domain S-box protein [candidate division KSB1 bacterium]|nr:PAS domain S-box protein [candidate division KSB1 bacterium]